MLFVSQPQAIGDVLSSLPENRAGYFSKSSASISRFIMLIQTFGMWILVNLATNVKHYSASRTRFLYLAASSRTCGFDFFQFSKCPCTK